MRLTPFEVESHMISEIELLADYERGAMNVNSEGRILCEQCNQPNGALHVVDEFGTGAGKAVVEDEDDDWTPDYTLVCYKCVSNIGAWAPQHWLTAHDNHKRLLWTREGGQVFTSDGVQENRNGV